MYKVDAGGKNIRVWTGWIRDENAELGEARTPVNTTPLHFFLLFSFLLIFYPALLFLPHYKSQAGLLPNITFFPL